MNNLILYYLRSSMMVFLDPCNFAKNIIVSFRQENAYFNWNFHRNNSFEQTDTNNINLIKCGQ